jgi:acetolactate synthase-1/2/3 large subunit
VVVLGASLAPDYMRFRDKKLLDPERQKIIQVDIDPRNSGWVYPVEQSITGDVADVLELLAGQDLGEGRREGRIATIAENNDEHGFGKIPANIKPAAPGTVHLSELTQVIDRSLQPDDMLTLDAGSNRIWATSILRVATPGQLVVPGGVGGMGWGLPAAAATRLVYPERNIICLIGDGGAAMTISTLATCVQEDLPITVIVANNQGLGMVRDNMKGRRIGSDFSPIDFAAVAEGMGCLGVRVNTPEALETAIANARHSGRTTVIDVTVDPAASHVDVSDYEGA